jgi:hypothetical protein
MAILAFDKNPHPQTLRWFGMIQAAALAMIAGMIWWRFQSPLVAQGVLIFAGLFLAAYYAIPPLRRSLYLAAMYLTFPLGFVLSYFILGLLYFVVFTLIGLLLRLCGYDPLQRRLDRHAKSYWIARCEQRPAATYFRQF